MANKTNRTSQISADQLLIAGVKAHLMKVSTLTIASKDYTPTQVVDALQAGIDAANAAAAAKAAWLAATKANEAQIASEKPFKLALRALVMAMFSLQPSALNDFGFQPRTRKVLTVEEKAAAAAKSKATRAARHTVGPKARLAIKATTTNGPTVNVGSSSTTTKA